MDVNTDPTRREYVPTRREYVPTRREYTSHPECTSPAEQSKEETKPTEPPEEGCLECANQEECVGEPRDDLFLHIDAGRPGDLYCATCWHAFDSNFDNLFVGGRSHSSDCSDCTQEDIWV